jgi:hypothetical protein
MVLLILEKMEYFGFAHYQLSNFIFNYFPLSRIFLEETRYHSHNYSFIETEIAE